MRKQNSNSRYAIRSTQGAPSHLDLDPKKQLDPLVIAHADSASQNVGSSDAVLVVGRLSEVLSGPLGALAIQNMRVRPRQARSIESVERILSVGAEMMLRQMKTEDISIEKISSEAGVTPQAAYRYFKDADELIETGLRCIVIREHERLIMLLSDRVLPDVAEMAKIVVGIVLETCERLQRFPKHVRENLLQLYLQMGYDASQLMAELICKDVSDADVRHSLDVTKTSVALTAIIAVATSFVSKGLLPQRGGRLEGMLANLFVGVFQSGGSPSDAFWELGDEFEGYLRAEER